MGTAADTTLLPIILFLLLICISKIYTANLDCAAPYNNVPVTETATVAWTVSDTHDPFMLCQFHFISAVGSFIM